MNLSLRRFIRVLVLAAIGGVALIPMVASADPAFYQGPIFEIASVPGGKLLVADSNQGIVNADTGDLEVPLPGVSDLAARRGGGLWALASDQDGGSLFRIKPSGQIIEVANLAEFEQEENPHPDLVESNPFDVADLGHGKALVADAAGNDLLRVNTRGDVKALAIFPSSLVPTAEAKQVAGCPNPPVPELQELCDAPAEVPAESVPTSVAVGPDGAYYVGELRGFPAGTGEARVWRVARNAKEADCGNTSKCRVVLDGFTTIIDLQFGPDGRLYVAQLEDAGLPVFELAPDQALGGSVHACNLKSGDCEEVVSGIPILTSIAFRCDGGNGSGGDGDDDFGFNRANGAPQCSNGDECDDFAFGVRASGNKEDDDDDDDDKECDAGGFTLWGAFWSLVPGQADVAPLPPPPPGP
jgi:hypothetical protein